MVKAVENGLNKKLSALLGAWQQEGSTPQESFDWTSSRSSWSKSFPQHAKFIETLPRSIGRSYVRKLCQGKKHTVIEKFLTVMIWGYGDRGYGPYRVSIMLSQPQAEVILEGAFRLCRSGKPQEAYEFLQHNRIRNLGPSFGTKFLTFCTPKKIGAPILDSYVGLWLKKYAAKDFINVSLNSENWNIKTYKHYWDWVKLHSQQFDCDPDDVELVLFRSAERIFSANSKWAGK
jgi:hypothetical protein